MKKVIRVISGFIVLLILAGCPAPTDPVLSNAKRITKFSFTAADNSAVLSSDLFGIISGPNIEVAAPYGTDLTSLVATFTTTGVSVFSGDTVQISGTTANDFTAQVVYTVTAEDGSKNNYTVLVGIIAASEDASFGYAANPGDSGVLTLTESSKSLTMILANNSPSVTFPTGWDDSGEETLTTRFWMGETEVTNDVMAAVLQWAHDNNKFSSTVGEHNGLDSSTVKHGGQHLFGIDEAASRIDYDGAGTFSAETGYENYPVEYVSWYGAVIICNWLTEIRDGNTANVVYTGIDTTWQADETIEDITKTGYRLPSCNEWEYAARYRTDSTNTAAGYTDPWFTKGDSASGAVANYEDAVATGAVAAYGESNPNLLEIKSLLANSLGIYDMSGNVYEWCFTKYENSRVSRGGCYATTKHGIYLADWGGDDPAAYWYGYGFRLVRTAN